MRIAALLTTAFLCLSLGATAARAQEVELYDQPHFAGIRLALSSDAADLNAWGIGRRTASVVVRSGQWEFCTQAHHGGNCITVGPGRYPELPGGLRGSIIAARNVARQAAAPPSPPLLPTPPRPPGLPGAPGFEAVTLFATSDFNGPTLAVGRPNPRLSNDGYNDMARAIEIRRGRWQLCEHSDYAGECTVYPPGRHVLQGRLAGRLSSLRPVHGADNRPFPMQGGVVLYEHSNFQGHEVMISDTVLNLAGMGFNDSTSSIEVLWGQWEFCTDADFRGRCFVLGPGRHNLERTLNDKISSIRPLLAPR